MGSTSPATFCSLPQQRHSCCPTSRDALFLNLTGVLAEQLSSPGTCRWSKLDMLIHNGYKSHVPLCLIYKPGQNTSHTHIFWCFYHSSGTHQSHLISLRSSLTSSSLTHTVPASLHSVPFLLSQFHKPVSHLCYQSIHLCSFFLPSASSSEIPSASPITFEDLKCIIIPQCFAPLLGRYHYPKQQLLQQTAELISLAFSSPTIHKGPHWNKGQQPCLGCSADWTLSNLSAFLKKNPLLSHALWLQSHRTNMAQRHLPSTLDYHVYIICVYTAIF